MNKLFEDHVTNVAFFLSISKKQIKYLERLFNTPWPSPDYYERGHVGTRQDPDNWLGTYKALCNKGLAIWKVDNPIRETGHFELTEAGRLTCLLLIEARLLKESVVVQEVA